MMERRSMQDRRIAKERRRLFNIKKYFFGAEKDRRDSNERRNASERRSGWIRLSKWSSVYLPKLKIAKFLKISK